MTAHTSRALSYYVRWTRKRYPSERIYIALVSSVIVTSFAICWIVAAQTGKSFEWWIWLKLSTIFSIGGSVFVFVAMKANIHGSWIVVKQVHDLLKCGQREKAWKMLLYRYRDIHPLVVGEAAFYALLTEAAKISPESQSRLFADGQNCASFADDEPATRRIEFKAKRAVIFILMCCALALISYIVRIFSIM